MRSHPVTIYPSPDKEQRLHQLQRFQKLISFGNWAKLHVSQVLAGGNIMHNCTVVMHAIMVRSHLWKAVLLHCSSSFFSVLLFLLDFTLRKNRKPYKRNNSARSDYFKDSVEAKQLKSAMFCGINCPLHAVSRIDSVQRCNVYSVPAFPSRNTRCQANLTGGEKVLLV